MHYTQFLNEKKSLALYKNKQKGDLEVKDERPKSAPRSTRANSTTAIEMRSKTPEKDDRRSPVFRTSPARLRLSTGKLTRNASSPIPSLISNKNPLTTQSMESLISLAESKASIKEEQLKYADTKGIETLIREYQFNTATYTINQLYLFFCKQTSNANASSSDGELNRLRTILNNIDHSIVESTLKELLERTELTDKPWPDLIPLLGWLDERKLQPIFKRLLDNESLRQNTISLLGMLISRARDDTTGNNIIDINNLFTAIYDSPDTFIEIVLAMPWLKENDDDLKKIPIPYQAHSSMPTLARFLLTTPQKEVKHTITILDIIKALARPVKMQRVWYYIANECVTNNNTTLPNNIKTLADLLDKLTKQNQTIGIADSYMVSGLELFPLKLELIFKQKEFPISLSANLLELSFRTNSFAFFSPTSTKPIDFLVNLAKQDKNIATSILSSMTDVEIHKIKDLLKTKASHDSAAKSLLDSIPTAAPSPTGSSKGKGPR